ncbi:hypothetical protein ILYODFUR_039220 [Ilyodon furcidens]|uniref:Uncharacterized protein n=1 Tax=Ilyodon furcidens TaxID=33524 RepID=A0ABV0VLG2_9TELE
MLKTWRIQRVHILRGCLSDPELSEGIMYRYGGTLQLNHVPGERAKVPIWIPVRGTSQQEGYHFHQAQWVTGNLVSTELFQAQGMTGVVRWNYQRLVDLKQPGVVLPAVFDPALIAELNTSSKRVTGQEKYPALQISNRDTGERFGLQYEEPGCRPVPLDWDKHRTLKRGVAAPPQLPLPSSITKQVQTPHVTLSSNLTVPPAEASAAQPASSPSSGGFQKQEIRTEFLQVSPTETSHPLPLRSSPRSARTGAQRPETGTKQPTHSYWVPWCGRKIYILSI